MITQRCFERVGDQVLWRIAVNDVAVFDVLTTDDDLARCRSFLEDPPASTESVSMGTFGPFEVTLNRDADGVTICLFICNPATANDFRGHQCVGAYLTRENLIKALDESMHYPPKDA